VANPPGQHPCFGCRAQWLHLCASLLSAYDELRDWDQVQDHGPYSSSRRPRYMSALWHAGAIEHRSHTYPEIDHIVGGGADAERGHRRQLPQGSTVQDTPEIRSRGQNGSAVAESWLGAARPPPSRREPQRSIPKRTQAYRLFLA
jgi:hypothetical protein